MNFQIVFGRSFNSFFQRLVREQLSNRYTFKEAYYSFAHRELRIIATDEQGKEHRYAWIDGELISCL